MTRRAIGGLVWCAAVAAALGWAAPGHRVITRTAVGLASEDLPAWVLDNDTMARIAFQANEPDRWRGIGSATLNDENNGDHYIDVEQLGTHGLTLETLPALRYEYVAALARTGEVPSDASEFKSGDVGFLPYAISEHYAKLVSSFNTERIIESLEDPARAQQLEAERANVVREMGQLSHFVGDASQPLHTTIHHHGWVGDNPEGFTTEGGFHAYIDSDVVALHRLNVEALSHWVGEAQEVKPGGAFAAGVALIARSHAAVKTLYTLERDGELDGEVGRAFIAAQLGDGGEVLAGLYRAAWAESKPTAEQVEAFEKYNSFGAEESWGHEAR